MEESSYKKLLKEKRDKIKEEEKKPNLYNNYNGGLSQEEYLKRSKNCFFFMRSPIAKFMIFEEKPDSKKKKKKKKKIFYYNYHNQLNPKNNSNLLSSKKNQKKENKITYTNLQPKNIWLKCKKVYNKCSKDYIALKSKFNDRIKKDDSLGIKINDNDIILINQKSKNILNNNNPRLLGRRKTLFNSTIQKNFFLNNLSKSRNTFLKKENNFIKHMNKTINSNFVNKGVNRILSNLSIEHIKDLKQLNSEKDKNINNNKNRINASYKLQRGLSLLNIYLPKLPMAKKMGISLDFEYKIKSFFELGTKSQINSEKEEDNNIEMISEKGKLILRESENKEEKIENPYENQSDLNFFCLNKILRLDEFHIFGLISGKGKDSKKCSRLLKKIFKEKFSDENNYFNDKTEKKNYNQIIDYILEILTKDNFQFIKKIFNSLNDELTKEGINIEETGASIALIIFIKDKVISLKIGDINAYFVYGISDVKKEEHIIVRNPHLEHSIDNILEQDRLEEYKCEIKVYKNEINKKNYKIEYKSDIEIQKLINRDNIKNTRMLGYEKLKKIGIINEPEIRTFSMRIEKNKYEKLPSKRITNKNLHLSDNDFSMLIKMKGINFQETVLKFVLLGNKDLFEILGNSYYIKEINEALIKDRNDSKNQENIKYCFNMKKTLKMLINESIDLYKKYMSMDNFKDRAIGLVTLDGE